MLGPPPSAKAPRVVLYSQTALVGHVDLREEANVLGQALEVELGAVALVRRAVGSDQELLASSTHASLVDATYHKTRRTTATNRRTFSKFQLTSARVTGIQMRRMGCEKTPLGVDISSSSERSHG